MQTVASHLHYRLCVISHDIFLKIDQKTQFSLHFFEIDILSHHKIQVLTRTSLVAKVILIRYYILETKSKCQLKDLEKKLSEGYDTHTLVVKVWLLIFYYAH